MNDETRKNLIDILQAANEIEDNLIGNKTAIAMLKL
jgi:hypothetical protein